ncbi:hypothetical protein AMTRI_Chr09g16630 [Amborella trichopoda]
MSCGGAIMEGDASSTATSSSSSSSSSTSMEPQVMREDYGMFTWPSSVVLAEYVWQQRAHFSGRTVIELGAGTALPGLVAAKVGADVILTDSSNRPEILDNMRQTCDLNKVNCKIMGLTWGEWDAGFCSLNPQIVLGADVLYDSSDFEDLFASVTFLLRSTPGSIFITAYHNRSGHHLVEYLMVKWGLKCVKLLDAFSFMPASKASTLQGNFELIEVKLESDLVKGEWRRMSLPAMLVGETVGKFLLVSKFAKQSVLFDSNEPKTLMTTKTEPNNKTSI